MNTLICIYKICYYTFNTICNLLVFFFAYSIDLYLTTILHHQRFEIMFFFVIEELSDFVKWPGNFSKILKIFFFVILILFKYIAATLKALKKLSDHSFVFIRNAFCAPKFFRRLILICE